MPLPVNQWREHANPQFNSGLANLLAPFLNRWMGGQGMMPGQFAPNQNWFDRSQGLDFQRQMQAAMRQGGAVDQVTYRELFRGAYATAHGSTWGKEQEKAASAFASQLAAMGPSLARMMPMTFDQLHGARGSAQVMAMHVFDAGHFLYNPAARGVGLDGNQAGMLTRALHGELFGVRRKAEEDRANLARMSGLGAGQAGQMFNEMARRGMVGRLSGHLGTDTHNIAGKMREMSGAVRAMQDVFGDMGKPDAPMRVIFDTLDKVTQGGLATMSPAKVRDIVRRTSALAKSTGQSFEAVAGMISSGASMAEAAGLHRQFGVATAHSAAAFGHAYGAMAGTAGFGGLSKAEATSLDQRLRTSAAASAQGNALGAVANMAEQGLIDGIDTSTPQGKAALQRLLQQMGGMNRSQMEQHLRGLGVRGGTFASFLSGRQANQGAALRHNVADVVRGNQFREVSRLMDNALTAGATGALGDGKMGAAVGRAMREIITTMDPELLNNPEKTAARNDAIVAALRARGLNVDRSVVARAFNTLDQRVRSNPALAQFGNVGGLVALNRGDILAGGKKAWAAADKAGTAAGKAAGTGQQDVIRRIVDAIRRAGRDPSQADLTKIVAAALGGVPADRAHPAGGGGGGGEQSAPAGGDRPIRIHGRVDIRNGDFEAEGRREGVPVPR